MLSQITKSLRKMYASEVKGKRKSDIEILNQLILARSLVLTQREKEPTGDNASVLKLGFRVDGLSVALQKFEGKFGVLAYNLVIYDGTSLYEFYKRNDSDIYKGNIPADIEDEVMFWLKDKFRRHS